MVTMVANNEAGAFPENPSCHPLSRRRRVLPFSATRPEASPVAACSANHHHHRNNNNSNSSNTNNQQFTLTLLGLSSVIIMMMMMMMMITLFLLSTRYSNVVDTNHVVAQHNEVVDDTTVSEWHVYISENATVAPFSEWTPRLNVIWSRGWYNAQLPPSSVPLVYYNEPNRETMSRLWNPHDQKQYWNPTILCAAATATAAKGTATATTRDATTYLWLRPVDVKNFVKHVERHLTHFVSTSATTTATAAATAATTTRCNITLITSDGDPDIPTYLDKTAQKILFTMPFVHQWYTQNLVQPQQPQPQPQPPPYSQNKLLPIPIGLGLHSDKTIPAFQVIQTMTRIRRTQQQPQPQQQPRSRSILVDVGSLSSCERRFRIRSELNQTMYQCGIIPMPWQRSTTNVWKRFVQHQFAVAPTGCGWDTHRLWELLFFQTIPIVLSSPLDGLLLPAHVPVVIVDSWQQVCELQHNATLYHRTLQRYQHWIPQAHEWLQPKVWIPRNQSHFNALCDALPGCREAARLSHRLY